MRKVSYVFAVCLAITGVARTQEAAAQVNSPVQQTGVPETPKTDQPAEEKKPPKGVIHVQEVKDPPEVHADQPCNNFSWAASLAAVLASQHVDLKQDFWVDRYYGGSLCLDEIGSPDDLIRKAGGDYTLDDGRHVQITMQYFSGLPSDSSALLVPIMTGEIVILFVDGRAELLVGAMWDEYHSNRGERMIDVKELHLLDPLQPVDTQKVFLDVTGADAVKVSGFMKVKVVEPHPQYWPKPN
jgi:hypothetical protein